MKKKPAGPGPRLFNVDSRSCLDPAKGWQPVAAGVPIAEVTRILHDGLELPELSPHVYRAYHVNDNPGP